MKKELLIIILLVSLNSFSQTMNYGLVLGINSTDTDPIFENPMYPKDPFGLDGFNIGAYLDYPINNKLGVKNYLTYNSEVETYKNAISTQQFFSDLDIKITSIQLSSVLKYHFNNEYNQGFYILSGPRISHILSTESESIVGLDTHNKFNFGLQIGFGVNFLKFINAEFIGDYSFSDITKDENYKVNSFILKLNLNLNIGDLINK